MSAEANETYPEFVQGPGDEDLDKLAIDESLPDLAKFQRYIASDVTLHRISTIRELGDTAKQIGYTGTVQHVVPTLKALVSDSETDVRQALVENITKLAQFLVEHGSADGVAVVTRSLLPVVGEALSDGTAQIRNTAGTALITFARLLPADVVRLDVFALVRRIAGALGEEKSQIERRIEACSLLDQLCPTLHRDTAATLAVPLFATLATDSVFRVRKAAAGSMGGLCDTVGSDHMVASVLPLFVKLAEDEIWGVRKACAESLAAVSRNVPQEIRGGQLTELLRSLVKDVSRWVRGAAFQSLGAFIATFDKDEVTEELLALFNQMASPASIQTIDAEITTHCAFAFPGVLFTVGPTRWGELQATYELLVRDHQWKVRRTLAHSLHEVARVLGPELADLHLSAPFGNFLVDLDEVKVGTVRHMTLFLAVLQPAAREKFLPAIRGLQTESDNWRFRESLAEQLHDMVPLFSADAAAETFVPLSQKLCHDTVACVRTVALSSIAAVINRLQPGMVKNEFVASVVALASAESFRDRQMFAQACTHLAHAIDASLFAGSFLPYLLHLAEDRVPNVRMAVARVLMETRLQDTYPEVGDSLAALRQDRDRDVRSFAL